MEQGWYNLFEVLARTDFDAHRGAMTSLLRVYKAHEQGDDPKPEAADLDNSLALLAAYYKFYYDFYNDYVSGVTTIPISMQELYDDYLPVYKDIQKALSSTDLNVKSIALDNGINMWHIDWPVIKHLMADANTAGIASRVSKKQSQELAKLGKEIWAILKRLGRLPKDTPYQAAKQDREME
jgi:hypothetical protein